MASETTALCEHGMPWRGSCQQCNRYLGEFNDITVVKSTARIAELEKALREIIQTADAGNTHPECWFPSQAWEAAWNQAAEIARAALKK